MIGFNTMDRATFVGRIPEKEADSENTQELNPRTKLIMYLAEHHASDQLDKAINARDNNLIFEFVLQLIKDGDKLEKLVAKFTNEFIEETYAGEGL